MFIDRERETGKFHRRFPVVIDHRLIRSGADRSQKPGKSPVQMDQFRLFIRIRRPVGIQRSLGADLFGGDGTQAGERGVERFGKLCCFFTDQCGKVLLCDSEGIGFFLCVRNKICPSGQNFPDRTHLGGYMLDAVDDLIGIRTEDNIAVLSHDLHDQIFPAQIAQLIQMLDLKPQDSLKGRLCDGQDPSSADVFPKQHAEVRRRHGAGFVCSCQIDKRQACACREEKPEISFSGFYRQQKFVGFWLCDLRDPSARQFFL